MTTYSYKQACIFGGTGFLGSQIVGILTGLGYTVKVATRTPAKAYFLKPAGKVGQVVPMACDISDEASVRAVIKGCAVVVNCVGILAEKKKGAFEKIHVDLAKSIARLCREEGAARLIHISALSCDRAESVYAKTKRAGEKAVFENFPDATILRPSVIFGAGDNFFNMFAKLSMLLPALPLIGGGHTKFQPVYVGDVAAAAGKALDDDRTKGQIYELGGPEVVTFRDIYNRLFAQTGRRRFLVTLPWGLATFDAALMSVLPNPPLTKDQIVSLKTDNVVQSGALTLSDLGITPESMEAILPTYLSRYRKGGRFADKKRA